MQNCSNSTLGLVHRHTTAPTMLLLGGGRGTAVPAHGGNQPGRFVRQRAARPGGAAEAFDLLGEVGRDGLGRSAADGALFGPLFKPGLGKLSRPGSTAATGSTPRRPDTSADHLSETDHTRRTTCLRMHLPWDEFSR